MRAVVRRQSTTSASAAAAAAAGPFAFDWQGQDKPRTFTQPVLLGSPTPKLYKPPTLVEETRRSKYKYDLNELISLTKQVKKCASAAELEALVKVTPYRIFNAFSIATIYSKFSTFVPEAKAVGTKKVEGEVESKFVRPSVSCVQHMFLPLMDLEFTPKSFLALSSAMVATQTPIPAFVLFKLRWAKFGAFEPLDLAKTVYNFALNMPWKEPYEPMLSEMKGFELEVFTKAVNLVSKKQDSGVLAGEYGNHALAYMSAALAAYYAHDRPANVSKLFASFRAIAASRPLSDLSAHELVTLLAVPLLQGNVTDEAFTKAIASQVAKRGPSAFQLPELEHLSLLFQDDAELFSHLQAESAKKQIQELA